MQPGYLSCYGNGQNTTASKIYKLVSYSQDGKNLVFK